MREEKDARRKRGQEKLEMVRTRVGKDKKGDEWERTKAMLD